MAIVRQGQTIDRRNLQSRLENGSAGESVQELGDDSHILRQLKNKIITALDLNFRSCYITNKQLQ